MGFSKKFNGLTHYMIIPASFRRPPSDTDSCQNRAIAEEARVPRDGRLQQPRPSLSLKGRPRQTHELEAQLPVAVRHAALRRGLSFGSFVLASQLVLYATTRKCTRRT